MWAFVVIDIAFDFRTDTPVGADPDAASPTMLHYHHLLWSKPLPSGRPFELTPIQRRPYFLVHDSDLGRFELTSDTALPTFAGRRQLTSIIGAMPPSSIAELERLRYTIGGMVLRPGTMIGGQRTINQERGWSHHIKDRFDLTVACVRRHYAGDTAHPLAGVFARYRDFFALFDDFAGDVAFWLLDDLLEPDDRVKEFVASDGCTRSPIPQTAAEYAAMCEQTIEFIKARNERIAALGR